MLIGKIFLASKVVKDRVHAEECTKNGMSSIRRERSVVANTFGGRLVAEKF